MTSTAYTRALRARFGPWAIVTGASDGIGRSFATALAAAGFDLVLVARRHAVLAALADELAAAHNVRTRVIAADLADAAALRAVLSQTEELDVGLFVAAAGYGTSGPFVDNRVGDELDMIQVNCVAVAALTHEIARRMVARKRGAIVLLSSLVAFQGVARAANYAATKAYVQSLAEGLRIELAPSGVEVLACAPGPVRSGFATRASMVMGAAQTPDEVALGALAALGRRGTVRPGLLAKALEWSLSLLPRWGRVWAMSRVMASMTPRAPRTIERGAAS